MSVNLGRVAYVEKGTYNPDTVYEKKDVVFFDGGSYVFTGDAPAAGTEPTDGAYWQPMLVPPKSSDMMPGLFIQAEASGDVVHITDGAALPVQSLITHVAPHADGSGRDHVSVTRAGKNLAAFADKSTISAGVAITMEAGVITMNGMPTSPSSGTVLLWKSVLKPGTYTLSHSVLTGAMVGAPENGSVLMCGSKRTRLNAPATTFTVEEEEEFSFSVVRATSATTYDNFTFTVQLEWGNAATDFVPPDVQVISVDLPQEVTEGEYDWLQGTLTQADGTVYQQDKHSLSTRKGVNTLWSDGGETEVAYVADPGLYIDQKIEALAAMYWTADMARIESAAEPADECV